MSDYLTNLIARTLNPAAVVPRLPSRFEPVRAGDGGMSADSAENALLPATLEAVEGARPPRIDEADSNRTTPQAVPQTPNHSLVRLPASPGYILLAADIEQRAPESEIAQRRQIASAEQEPAHISSAPRAPTAAPPASAPNGWLTPTPEVGQDTMPSCADGANPVQVADQDVPKIPDETPVRLPSPPVHTLSVASIEQRAPVSGVAQRKPITGAEQGRPVQFSAPVAEPGAWTRSDTLSNAAEHAPTSGTRRSPLSEATAVLPHSQQKDIATGNSWKEPSQANGPRQVTRSPAQGHEALTAPRESDGPQSQGSPAVNGAPHETVEAAPDTGRPLVHGEQPFVSPRRVTGTRRDVVDPASRMSTIGEPVFGGVGQDSIAASTMQAEGDSVPWDPIEYLESPQVSQGAPAAALPPTRGTPLGKQIHPQIPAQAERSAQSGMATRDGEQLQVGPTSDQEITTFAPRPHLAALAPRPAAVGQALSQDIAPGRFDSESADAIALHRSVRQMPAVAGEPVHPGSPVESQTEPPLTRAASEAASSAGRQPLKASRSMRAQPETRPLVTPEPRAQPQQRAVPAATETVSARMQSAPLDPLESAPMASTQPSVRPALGLEPETGKSPADTWFGHLGSLKPQRNREVTPAQASRRASPSQGASEISPAEPPTTIQVTIGRVEVRATTTSPASGPTQRQKSPKSNLDEYLRRRNGGGS
jgi:hypothetical protein